MNAAPPATWQPPLLARPSHGLLARRGWVWLAVPGAALVISSLILAGFVGSSSQAQNDSANNVIGFVSLLGIVLLVIGLPVRGIVAHRHRRRWALSPASLPTLSGRYAALSAGGPVGEMPAGAPPPFWQTGGATLGRPVSAPAGERPGAAQPGAAEPGPAESHPSASAPEHARGHAGRHLALSSFLLVWVTCGYAAVLFFSAQGAIEGARAVRLQHSSSAAHLTAVLDHDTSVYHGRDTSYSDRVSYTVDGTIENDVGISASRAQQAGDPVSIIVEPTAPRTAIAATDHGWDDLIPAVVVLAFTVVVGVAIAVPHLRARRNARIGTRSDVRSRSSRDNLG